MFSAAVGSSMISTRELKDSALAISTICCLATVSAADDVRGSSVRFMRVENRPGLPVELVLVEEQAEAPASARGR